MPPSASNIKLFNQLFVNYLSQISQRFPVFNNTMDDTVHAGAPTPKPEDLNRKEEIIRQWFERNKHRYAKKKSNGSVETSNVSIESSSIDLKKSSSPNRKKSCDCEDSSNTVAGFYRSENDVNDEFFQRQEEFYHNYEKLLNFTLKEIREAQQDLKQMHCLLEKLSKK